MCRPLHLIAQHFPQYFTGFGTIMSAKSSNELLGNDALQLGWIGLGSMGLSMACNIQKYLKANHMPNLAYWNRTLSKGGALRELGGEACKNAGDVAADCSVIFISVSRLSLFIQLSTDISLG